MQTYLTLPVVNPAMNPKPVRLARNEGGWIQSGIYHWGGSFPHFPSSRVHQMSDLRSPLSRSSPVARAVKGGGCGFGWSNLAIYIYIVIYIWSSTSSWGARTSRTPSDRSGPAWSGHGARDRVCAGHGGSEELRKRDASKHASFFGLLAYLRRWSEGELGCLTT